MGKVKLFDYQTRAINFMLSRPRGALFLDCGLGKTLITLTWLYLKRKEIKKTLIIAPLRVAEHTWTAEIEKWGIPLKVSKVLGKKEQREKALEKKSDIYIINTDNVVWLTKNYKFDFDCLIVDELSNFKSYNSNRFKALKKLDYKYFWGLTATPTPNGLMQLWPEIFLIDKGQRLGKSITKFRQRYCLGIPMAHGTAWTINPGVEDSIFEKVQDCCLSMDAVNPPRIIVNDIFVSMTKSETIKYEDFKREYVFKEDDSEVTASSAAVLAGKLRQLANGFIYDEAKKAIRFHNSKLDALEDLIISANGNPIMVFYSFEADKKAIQKRFPEASDLDIEAWNRGEIPLMLLHPASAGHGLNLQDGGHIIVWYGLNWDYELYHQANARLARTGQKETVIIHRIMTDGTIEEHIATMLSNKKNNMAALMAAVKYEGS
jgi:SNF2 family DNA or RNA helicase